MPKIQHLSQDVIAKIAAGEVIERPVYAVKELVENAIDAKAESIIINIEESGLKRITVIDNGEGMNEIDLQECWKPHATSKLLSIEDLTIIETLGFRGEALASIAAISKLTVQSRIKGEQAGFSVEIKDGKLVRTSSVGMPFGTQVTVENLFHATPGRKKFLKSARTEFRHIIETIMQFAFVHPDIHFLLTHDKKTIFDLPRTSESLDRINVLLGKELYASLLPIEYEDSYIQISGFVARPQMTTRNSQKQYLFVNKRTIGDKGIASAIKAAYGNLIEKQVYPISLLFLKILPEVVDINVHPRKEEVRFVNQSEIHEIIKRAVTQTLAKHDIVYRNSLWQESIYSEDEQFKSSTNSFTGKVLRDQSLPWSLSQPLKVNIQNTIQIHNLYILADTKQGFVLIDQHAAHERIRYEQLQNEFKKQKKKDNHYAFSKPKLFELSIQEQELLEEHLETFTQLGFIIEHFKGRSFLLRAVPELMKDRDPKDLISDILENLRTEGQNDSVDAVSQKIIAFLACRGAVKAGDILTKKQSLDLINQLEKTENNATCPHGRPTKILVDLSTINKMFKR